jgi:hypothetical protein
MKTCGRVAVSCTILDLGTRRDQLSSDQLHVPAILPPEKIGYVWPWRDRQPVGRRYTNYN